ncbi:hypothetical protein B0H66DRAFT_214883 [Apodospora peruviana]|uniref:Uncharacterized protein n=1 Tax=Apodospora peruviana TaxID=516989 RepID=A0AAE0ICW6_9PEZI|nr:hypothetical protein B0H66DRAFT_214883 [Apodospora peruviana]
MQLNLGLVGLLALSGANAATINIRKSDPLLFFVALGRSGQTCATMKGPFKAFHQSQLPADGCVTLTDSPVTSFMVGDSPRGDGFCTVVLYTDPVCGNPAPIGIIPTFHCVDGAFKSFKVQNCDV